MVHQGEVQEYDACWFSEEADKRANLVMNISENSQLQTLKQRTTGCEFLFVSLCTQEKALFHIYLFFYQFTSNQSLRRGCTAPTVGAGARKPKIKPPFRLLQSLQVPPSSHSTHIQLTDEKHSQQAASECEKVCEGSFAEHLWQMHPRRQGAVVVVLLRRWRRRGFVVEENEVSLLYW